MRYAIRLIALTCVVPLWGTAQPCRGEEPNAPILDIAARRELFVDHYLIDNLKNARLKLHHPQPAEQAIAFDRPWEGPHCGYVTVLKDGPTYRMYYRGLPVAGKDGSNNEVTCYAESCDGITWTKPDLGLFEVQGTRNNNVILANAAPCSHNFSPFLDTRPDVPADQRFKAVGGTAESGLVAFVSPDGTHWKKLRNEPILTKGAFDSQNVMFYSAAEHCYLCYFRTFKHNVRWITRSTSKDFLTWTDPVDMTYGDTPPEHLYTNNTLAYFRAPHIYVAVAARFVPDRRALTDQQAKALKVSPGYEHDCSDAVLLTTRGGNRYERTFMDGFIRPGPGLQHWVSRTNYPSFGLVPTSDAEMSLYLTRDYAQPTYHLRRYTLRTDGFISVNAGLDGGEMITRPFVFSGKTLVINYATSAAGSIRIEIQTPDGKPVPGRTLADSEERFGDEIDRTAAWKSGSDLSALAGRPVRLRVVLKDADLYAIQFPAP